MSPEPDRHITRTGEEYAEAMQALLPLGQAWPRHHDSVLMRLVRGLTRIWGDFEIRASKLLEWESDPRITVELLLDWERNWGLPDKCYATPQSVELRQKALVRRMTIEGAQSREFFIGVAAEIGYTITISEYRPFFIAMDGCGDCRVIGAPIALEDIVTLNPADKATTVVLSNGNLTCTTTANGVDASVRSTVGYSTGRRYFEMRQDSQAGNDAIGFGLAAANFSLNDWLGEVPPSIGVYGPSGWIGYVFDGVNYGENNTRKNYSVGEWIGIAVDFDAGKFWFNSNSGWSDCSYNWDDKHAAIYLFNSKLTVASDTPGPSAEPYTTQAIRSIVGHGVGRHYVEFKMDTEFAPEDIAFGLAVKEWPLYEWLGWSAGLLGWSIGIYENGVLHVNDTPSASGITFALGEWLGMAIDLDAGKIWFRNAAGWAGDPIAGEGSLANIPPGLTLHIVTQLYGVGDAATTNFGASTFAYDVPDGFKPWIGDDILAKPDVVFPPGSKFFAAISLLSTADIATVNFGATAFAKSPPPGFVAWEEHDPMRNQWHQPIMGPRGDSYVQPGQLSRWPNYGIGGVPYVNGLPVDASQALGPTTRYYWTVYVTDAGLQWFRCASGQCGVNPHLIIDVAEDLECLLDRWKPAHTDIIFDYSGLQTGGEMAGTP